MDSTGHLPDHAKHRKRLRLECFDYADPDHVYFVTVCSRHLSEPFSNPALAASVLGALLHQRHAGRVRIFAYVLMPDHLHIALSPCEGTGSVSEVIRQFKSYTTHLAWKHGVRGSLWQRSFYDHIARREESLLAICEYILANPVRKGLVSEVGQWPYIGMPDALPVG